MYVSKEREKAICRKVSQGLLSGIVGLTFIFSGASLCVGLEVLIHKQSNAVGPRDVYGLVPTFEVFI